MNKLLSIVGVSLLSITLTTGALALNPQPEPPGKNRVGHTTVLPTTGAVHGAASTDADDNYCGTPVPGHPHVNATGANAIIIEGKTHCNTHTMGSATGGAGSGRAHMNTIGSATSGAGSGR